MMMATSIEYGVPSRAVPCRSAVGGRLADLAVHRASRWSIALATPLATRPVHPDSDMYTMSGFGLFMRPLRPRTSKLGGTVGASASSRQIDPQRVTPLTSKQICATIMIAPLSAFSYYADVY